MSSTSDKIVSWLKEHPLINIRRLEKEVGMPYSTIGQTEHGREIPRKHIEPILKVLKKYGLEISLTSKKK